MMSRKSANLSRSWISSTTRCVRPSVMEPEPAPPAPARLPPCTSCLSSTPLVHITIEDEAVPFFSSRMEYPTDWPTFSPRSEAILSATEMALIRLGWVTTILHALPSSQHDSASIWGTWVVFPHPVSPASKTTWLLLTRSRISLLLDEIGSPLLTRWISLWPAALRLLKSSSNSLAHFPLSHVSALSPPPPLPFPLPLPCLRLPCSSGTFAASPVGPKSSRSVGGCALSRSLRRSTEAGLRPNTTAAASLEVCAVGLLSFKNLLSPLPCDLLLNPYFLHSECMKARCSAVRPAGKEYSCSSDCWNSLSLATTSILWPS
mmetsp:Transcript_10597/g.36621  ORF Transcript_10597/g.36621 Transcript_10597/m.36621 type:complete len:318 (-) Transcript_10597:469-1422(-)